MENVKGHTRKDVDNSVNVINHTYDPKRASLRDKNLESIKIIDKSNGFRGELYLNKETNKFIVCFCGTNDTEDIITDAQMALKIIPDQFFDAYEFMEYVTLGLKIPLSKIELITGHSLGGSLAQLIGRVKKYSHIKVLTINAYGTRKINIGKIGGISTGKIKHDKYYEIIEKDTIRKNNILAQIEFLDENNNIENYIVDGDVVPGTSKQVGRNYYISSLQILKMINTLSNNLLVTLYFAFKLEVNLHCDILKEKHRDKFDKAIEFPRFRASAEYFEEVQEQTNVETNDKETEIQQTKTLTEPDKNKYLIHSSHSNGVSSKTFYFDMKEFKDKGLKFDDPLDMVHYLVDNGKLNVRMKEMEKPSYLKHLDNIEMKSVVYKNGRIINNELRPYCLKYVA